MVPPHFNIKIPYCLPYKTLFPPGIQLRNPPSFVVVRDRFARIYNVACGADYQIREIPITGAERPEIFRQDKVIMMYLAIFEHTSLNFQHKS